RVIIVEVIVLDGDVGIRQRNTKAVKDIRCPAWVASGATAGCLGRQHDVVVKVVKSCTRGRYAMQMKISLTLVARSRIHIAAVHGSVENKIRGFVTRRAIAGWEYLQVRPAAVPDRGLFNDGLVRVTIGRVSCAPSIEYDPLAIRMASANLASRVAGCSGVAVVASASDNRCASPHCYLIQWPE